MAKKPAKKPVRGTETGGVDLVEVERLLAFMEKNGLEEFEYARGGTHIRLKKPSSAPVATSRAPAGWDVPPASHGPSEAPKSASHSAPPAADVHVIKSPIVGTFYGSPSPSADAFVTVGAKVESGQVLCIIEAMKLMNEIESDVAGEVVEIYAKNGEPVEYGALLFGIRARGKK